VVEARAVTTVARMRACGGLPRLATGSAKRQEGIPSREEGQQGICRLLPTRELIGPRKADSVPSARVLSQ